MHTHSLDRIGQSESIDKLILFAKSVLKDNPPDKVHDFDHHDRVWKMCLKISQVEKVEVDLKSLELCAFWHDLTKHNDTLDIRKVATLTTLDTATIDRLHTLINSHGWNSKPTDPESKLLFDADKVDYVCYQRWENIVGTDTDLMTAKYQLYFENLFNRLPLLEDRLNYDSSKNFFRNKMDEFNNWAKLTGHFINGKYKYYKNEKRN